MWTTGVRVDVETGGIAVAGRLLEVTAVVTAETDVQVLSLALGYVGRWWRRPLVPTPGMPPWWGKDVWGLVTPVDRLGPVRLRAGEARRWSAVLGPASYPTLPPAGTRLLGFRHDVEVAVCTDASLRMAEKVRPVEVLAPSGLYPGVAGHVLTSDPRAPVRVVAAEAAPGGAFVLRTVPGATVELVRTERRGRTQGPIGRKRRMYGRVMAGPDGTAVLPVPIGAAPSIRTAIGEIRWSARVGIDRARTEVILVVFQHLHPPSASC